MPSSVRFALIAVLLLTTAALGMITSNMTRSTPASMQVVQTSAPPPLLLNQLVAARPIPVGTLIRDEDFTMKSLPSAHLMPGGLPDTSENRANLRGALMRHYIDAGSQISMADVLQPRDRGFLASVLKEGHRAVAVGVDQVSGVAGLIWPGDHVDILLTQATEGDLKSLVVLTDTRVVAIDQDMVQSAPTNNAVAGKIVRTVTVEVNPSDAQKLAVAERMGKLSLAIRAAVDHPIAMPGVVTAIDISPSGAPQRTIQVFNGSDRKEVIFR